MLMAYKVKLYLISGMESAGPCQYIPFTVFYAMCWSSGVASVGIIDFETLAHAHFERTLEAGRARPQIS